MSERAPVEHYEPTSFERWALRGAVSALVAVVAWIGVAAINGQEATTKAVNALSQNMAVVQAQMTALTSNVNDVRALTNTVAQMQVVQTEHERRIQLLEAQRSRPQQ